MAQCLICSTTSPYISRELGVCLNCIREKPESALPIATTAHAKSRALYGLPEVPPKADEGVSCSMCVNECKIPEDHAGYCGVRTNKGGEIVGVSADKGKLPFSLRASRLALEENKGRILRICWETNGSMHGSLLDQMMDVALASGGCIKFDLKTWDENLHKALTGVTNARTLENFRRAGEKISQRPSPPLLIASTLMVPGYIDEREIRNIAKFIASICPDIPYSLLAFHPHFYMSDMPFTSRALAYTCRNIAHEEGLRNVRIGNLHLLVQQ
jgi:hypothetical protein